MYTGFPLPLLDLLRCPLDEGTLVARPSAASGDRLVAGTLECASCGAAFPVEEGIADLALDDRLNPESAHESRLRDEKARAYGTEPVDDEVDAGVLSWHLFEKHFLRLKDRYAYDAPARPRGGSRRPVETPQPVHAAPAHPALAPMEMAEPASR